MRYPRVDFSALSETSKQYRSELSAAAAVPGTSLIVCEYGHGTSLAAIAACEYANARTMLLVVSKPAKAMWLEQLEHVNIKAVATSGKKGSMGDICRQAVSYTGDAPVAFVASPNEMAEAGHWCDAWKNKKPFDFVAVLDAENFRNMRSEKNQGLKDVIGRAGNAVLLVDRNTDPYRIRELEQAWDLHAVSVLPRTAHAAASGCEAMGMESD